MAISEALVDVELINTFEDWRVETNKALKVLRESSDDDPVSAIISTDFTGAAYVNVITTNSFSSNTITGVNLIFTGQASTIDFTNANVVSLGIAKEIKVQGGSIVSGSNPDSYIQSVQIRDSEILLNGQDLRSDGPSEIDFTEATITNLGEIQKINVYPVIPTGGTGTAGTLHGVSLKINSTATGTLTVLSGSHNFTGATVIGGKYDASEFYSGVIHSTNITANTGSYLITNTSAIFASNDDANVAIGKFPEWSGPGSLRYPVSSSGRLHIRREFADTNAQQTTVDVNGDEVVIEGNTSVGMTLISNTASNTNIYFGDSDSTTQGFLIYDNQYDRMVLGVDGTETLKIYPENGGGVEIASSGYFEPISAKLHIHQNSTEGTPAFYINADRGNQSAMVIDSDQSSAHIVDINTTLLSSGNMIDMRYETSSTSWIGSFIEMNDDNNSSDIRSLFVLNQNHEDAVDTRLIDLYTKAGKGIFLNSDSNFYSLYIDAENSTQNTVDILSDNLTTGSAFFVRSTSDHTSNLVSIFSDNAETSGSSLFVKTNVDNDLFPNNTLASRKLNPIDVVLFENATGKILNVESDGKVGINLQSIDGQEILVKRQTYDPSQIAPNEVQTIIGDSSAWHTLHVGGTLGVEANAIFNGTEFRVNSNVVHQNGNTTISLMDSHGEDGYAIFGIGENSSEFGPTSLYVTYPGAINQGYSYIGMGSISFDTTAGNESDLHRQEHWAIRFNQYNSSLLFSGELTVANSVIIENRLNTKDDASFDKNMTIGGNLTMPSSGVSMTDEETAFDKPGRFKSILTLEDGLFSNGGVFIDVTDSGDGAEKFEVTGNAVFHEPGPFIVYPLAYFHRDTIFHDDVTIDDDLLVKTDSEFQGDSDFTGNKIVTMDGTYRHTGETFLINSLTSNTTVRGTSILVGNTEIRAENVYISSSTSNTYTEGNLTVAGNVSFNGTLTDLYSSNINMTGHVYSTNSMYLVNEDDDTDKMVIVSKSELAADGSGYGNTTIRGELNNIGNTYISGLLEIAGGIKMTVDEADPNGPTPTLDMSDLDLYANNLFVEYNATIKGNLNVSEGDIIGSDDLFVNRNLIIRGENSAAEGHTNQNEPAGYLFIDNANANNYIAGDLMIGKGDLDIQNGTLRVSQGDIVGDDDLYVKGEIHADGNISSNGILLIDGSISTTNSTMVNELAGGTMYVTGPKTKATGNTWLTGNTTITKDLLVMTKLNVQKPVHFLDKLDVDKGITAKTLTVTGNTGFNEYVEIKKGLVVKEENVWMKEGTLRIESTSANNFIQDKLYVANDVNMRSDLDLQDDFTIHTGDILVKLGQIKTQLDLISQYGDLELNGINPNGDSAGGHINTKGKANSFFHYNTVMRLDGSGGASDANVWLNANTTIEQNLVVKKNLYVNGDIQAKTVAYETVSSSDQTVDGYVNAYNFVATSTSATSTLLKTDIKELVISKTSGTVLEVNGNAQFDKDVDIDGDIVQDTTKTATLGATDVVSLDLNDGNISDVDDIDCQTITVNDTSSTSATFKGNVKMENYLTVSAKSSYFQDAEFDGDVNVKGQLAAKNDGKFINCALPVYNAAGTLLNELTLSIT